MSFKSRNHSIDHVNDKSHGSLNRILSNFDDFHNEAAHMVRNRRGAESHTNRCLRMQIRLRPSESGRLQNKIQSHNSSNRDLESMYSRKLTDSSPDIIISCIIHLSGQIRVIRFPKVFRTAKTV